MRRSFHRGQGQGGSVNYLLSTEELERALTGMRRNLGPGGLLMFDVNTMEAYRHFFAEEVVVEREGKRLIWKGKTDPDAPPGSIAEASFEVAHTTGVYIARAAQ